MLGLPLSRIILTPAKPTGGGGRRALADWIFYDGTWSDDGYWQDTRNWADTGLFINLKFWDGGKWSDAMVW